MNDFDEIDKLLELNGKDRNRNKSYKTSLFSKNPDNLLESVNDDKSRNNITYLQRGKRNNDTFSRFLQESDDYGN